MNLSSRFTGRCLFAITASVFLLLTNTHAQSLGPAPAISTLQYTPEDNGWTKIAQATGNGWMHFPRGMSFDIVSGGSTVKRVLVNWQTSADSVMFPYTHQWMGSSNNGSTWNAPAMTASPNIDQMTSIRRHDGVLIAIPFYPNPFTGGNPQSSFSFSYDTSADNGLTWGKKTNGLVNGFGTQKLGSFRFHRGIIQDANGDLYTPAYGQFQISGGYETHRVMLLKSTDKGATWTYLSTVQFTSGISYNEASIVRCRDGSILCVMRNASNPLKYRRSTDNGVTWGGAVTAVPGLPANAGVDPYLYMMPNGVLVLAYGNNISASHMRHCMLAFAADGVGNSWTNVTTTFQSSTSGLGNKSSGYTAVWPSRINRAVQVADRALWTYYGSNRHPSPNPFSIWTKQVDIVLNHRNRIDLKQKYATGDISVTTDLTYTNAVHPEARIAGAFDGSTDYWSSAWKSGSSGAFTIDLKNDHLLNAVGVCLAVGLPQSGTVEYSQDGSSWTTIRTYPANTKHYTIDYTTLSTPITARYIRVNVQGGSLTGLNEIRLFSVADTYEDYAQNVAPVGYTLSDFGFWISEGVTPSPTGYQSQRALYMNDADDGNKEATKTTSAATQKTLDFWLRVKSYASSNGAVQWRLISGSTNAFRMRVINGGTVQWYNGSSYATISGASIPIDTWTHIKVSANAATGAGVLTINDANSYTIGKEATVSSLNGFRFASGGSDAVGDAALFDDVAFYDTPSSLVARAATEVSDDKLSVAPNPVVNDQTVIRYSLQKEAPVRIAVYGINGQMETLLNTRQQAGHYSLLWSTKGKPAGVYIVKLNVGRKASSIRVVINDHLR